MEIYSNRIQTRVESDKNLKLEEGVLYIVKKVKQLTDKNPIWIAWPSTSFKNQRFALHEAKTERVIL